MQIERGLRKSVDALHALAKKCKKEIEIQKTKNTNRICNHSCNCHLYKPTSTPDIQNNKDDSNTNGIAKKKRKNNKRRKKQKKELPAVQQDYPNSIVYQNHYLKQHEHQQQLNFQYQIQPQQQYQYELHKQKYFQHQQLDNNQNQPTSIYTWIPFNQMQPQHNQYLANKQKTQQKNQQQHQETSNFAQDPKHNATIQIMIEDLEDRLTTYAKCLLYDKKTVYNNLSKLENSIFKRQLKTLVEIDPLESENFKKLIDELIEDTRMDERKKGKIETE